jgi:hypothetical protein
MMAQGKFHDKIVLKVEEMDIISSFFYGDENGANA